VIQKTKHQILQAVQKYKTKRNSIISNKQIKSFNFRMSQLLVKIGPNGYKPTRGTKFSAGFDLYSSQESIILKRNRNLISTDIQLYLPEDYYGRIASRSGLSLNFGIEVGAGIIDRDYRGEIKVLLYNHSDEDFQIRKGERIAQLIVQQYFVSDLSVLQNAELVCENNQICAELTSEIRERNDQGFGSTGK